MPGRIHYRKIICGSLYFVIADLLPTGELDFWWQESGEMRWYPYEPGSEEKAAALRLLSDGGPGSGGHWPLLG